MLPFFRKAGFSEEQMALVVPRTSHYASVAGMPPHTFNRIKGGDVIEIDGASNRGIDEIRSLRANVGVRPSRSRYKIYIIDEVHMLTTPAFHALLKTLIFCVFSFIMYKLT